MRTMRMKIILFAVVAALAGCNGTGGGNNCPSDTPLPCAGSDGCCAIDHPVLCGGQCWNGKPTAAQCNEPITVCSDNRAGGSPCESGSYCYEWICSGDPECVSTNPNGTATGANDEGNDASCSGLLTFGNNFWGIPPAWQQCTLIP